MKLVCMRLDNGQHHSERYECIYLLLYRERAEPVEELEQKKCFCVIAFNNSHRVNFHIRVTCASYHRFSSTAASTSPSLALQIGFTPPGTACRRRSPLHSPPSVYLTLPFPFRIPLRISHNFYHHSFAPACVASRYIDRCCLSHIRLFDPSFQP